MVVFRKILPLLAAGVGMLFLVNAFTRPAHASQTAGALSESFASLGALGSSISSLGQGIGSGAAGLFKPIWEVSNLVERFSSLATGSANVGPVAQESTGTGSRTSSTITWNSGTTASVPSLSPAAKSYYKGLGVSVT